LPARIAVTAAPVRRGRVEIRHVLLGGHACGREPERPRGDDERARRTGQGLADRLDRAPVGDGRAFEVPREREVVLERQVDDRVGRGGRTTQRVEIVESAVLHLGTRGAQRRGRCFRPSEPDDLVAAAEELGNDGGADPTGRAGDENPHGGTSR
jgi:hypothetical protein